MADARVHNAVHFDGIRTDQFIIDMNSDLNSFSWCYLAAISPTRNYRIKYLVQFEGSMWEFNMKVKKQINLGCK